MDIFNKDDLRLKYNLGPTANDYKNPTKIRERRKRIRAAKKKKRRRRTQKNCRWKQKARISQTNIKCTRN